MSVQEKKIVVSQFRRAHNSIFFLGKTKKYLIPVKEKIAPEHDQKIAPPPKQKSYPPSRKRGKVRYLCRYKSKSSILIVVLTFQTISSCHDVPSSKRHICADGIRIPISILRLISAARAVSNGMRDFIIRVVIKDLRPVQNFHLFQITVTMDSIGDDDTLQRMDDEDLRLQGRIRMESFEELEEEKKATITVSDGRNSSKMIASTNQLQRKRIRCVNSLDCALIVLLKSKGSPTLDA